MDEFGWIDHLRKQLGRGLAAPQGIGDDAALISPSSHPHVVASDLMIEGVHFTRAWSRLEDVAFKLFAVNASDMLAMGAKPTHWLLNVAMPGEIRTADVEALIRGFQEAQTQWGSATLIGGDSSRSLRDWMLSITMLGETVASPWCRHGAQPGDVLWIDGPVGLAAAGLAVLQKSLAQDASDAVAQCVQQQLRPGRAQVANPTDVSAAIDISDGLVQDLGHIARASHVQIVLDDELPGYKQVASVAGLLSDDVLERSALCRTWQCHGGEDYVRVVASPLSPGQGWKRIGVVLEGPSEVWRDSADGLEKMAWKGWNHFDQPQGSS